jgi:hypothetical protein
MAGLIWFRRIRCSCWQRSTQRWLQILLLIGSDLFVCLWPENIVVPRLPAVSVMAPTVGCRGYSAASTTRQCCCRQCYRRQCYRRQCYRRQCYRRQCCV